MTTHTEILPWNGSIVRITYTFSKGLRATMPGLDGPGEPPEPAEVVLLNVVIVSEDDVVLGDLFEHHFESLHEDLFDDLCLCAKDSVE